MKAPQQAPFIVHETKNYFAIYKPAGVPFHAEETIPGLLQILRTMETAGTLPPLGPLFPVHRLDKPTSGLLLLARTPEIARLLGDCFQQHKIQKLYVALSQKKPKKKQGLVSGDMKRSRRGAWKLTRENQNPAITRFVSHNLASIETGMRGYLLRPKTGKTHQLRVAMKSVGAPIHGDTLYAENKESQLVDRMYLHACGISLQHPNLTIQLLLPPKEGTLFLSDAFQTFWTEQFPDGRWTEFDTTQTHAPMAEPNSPEQNDVSQNDAEPLAGDAQHNNTESVAEKNQTEPTTTSPKEG